MSDLVVIVPSRGRPWAVEQMAEAFDATCAADTALMFAVDEDDSALDVYTDAVDPMGNRLGICVVPAPSTMVHALNTVAVDLAAQNAAPAVVGFMGDDHRPRTKGWDAAYLAALELHPGLVFGNDLLQGANLPTQVAMSASVVRALGHMAPPALHHLYVDNYWLELGRETGCITYLPDVIVEHLHPVAGKADWDEGYKRVNDPTMYNRDGLAFAAYWAEYGDRDVAALRRAVAA